MTIIVYDDGGPLIFYVTEKGFGTDNVLWQPYYQIYKPGFSVMGCTAYLHRNEEKHVTETHNSLFGNHSIHTMNHMHQCYI